MASKSSLPFQTALKSRDLTDFIIHFVNTLPVGIRYDYLKEQFLTKFVSDETDSPLLRRTRAISKWLACERDNEGTNDRLMTISGDYNILPRVSYDRFMDKCRQVVGDIIGDVPSFDDLTGSFSGGASTSRARTHSLPGYKYTGKQDITLEALPYFELMLENCGTWRTWHDFDIRIVPGNVLFTVPKTTSIDRCAAKEPDLNMYMQKAVGCQIRRSLRRVGINLNDQSINRGLAREGSITNRLATLDLTSASDSVTRELVFQLLPIEWFVLCDAIRSHNTIIDGELHVNEMFSSMGNGFTFELESLLFYSIARTVAYFTGEKGVISVYGDDIVCPSSIADDLRFVLSVLGFTVNSAKSFSDGPFRESCGGHYHNGHDVTPVYLRNPVRDLTDVIHLANSFRVWADDTGIGILDPLIYPLWDRLSSEVPQGLWGASDNTRYALISPHKPRKRLVEVIKRKRLSLGGYLHWLNSTWDRDAEIISEPIETSIVSRETSVYRCRPQPSWLVNSVSSLFLEELK